MFQERFKGIEKELLASYKINKALNENEERLSIQIKEMFERIIGRLEEEGALS